ncbi:hypothetical protein TNCV_2459511 [Trichonephila clavipes]|nr:hypothetical protein TNCV_2459511 [Trichonephila clavipes]
MGSLHKWIRWSSALNLKQNSSLYTIQCHSSGIHDDLLDITLNDFADVMLSYSYVLNAIVTVTNPQPPSFIQPMQHPLQQAVGE